MKRLLAVAAIVAATLCVAVLAARPIFDFVIREVACATGWPCGAKSP